MSKTMKQPVASMQDQDKPVGISVLINSIFYFLSCVFILQLGEKYLLVVRFKNRVLHHAVYDTPRGAKIAFSKFFNKNTWLEKVKSSWTPFYLPGKKWLNKKLRGTGIELQ
jgi:hypothetical protein